MYGSAEYLEKKMRDWSDDVFFLELWEELQDRARDNTNQGQRKNLAGDMTVEHVADKTSAAVGNEEGGGALFDETAGAYRRLRVRTEGILTDTFVQHIRDSLRAYGKMNPWSALASPAAGGDEIGLAISAELDAPIELLQSYLGFLANALAQAPLRRIARQVVLAMQAFLWDKVLMQYTFSDTGAKQFGRDVRGLWEVVNRFVGVGQGEMGMRKLGEGLMLLELKGGEDGNEGEGLLLGDVEKRLFRDNESGREVLEEMGLEVLSETEARSVLERRIDLSG